MDSGNGTNTQSHLTRWQLGVRASGLGPVAMFGIAYSTWASPDGGRLWPSLETVARELGLNRQTAGKYRKALADAGWLERVAAGKVGAHGDVYHLSMPAPVVETVDNDETDDGRLDDGESDTGGAPVVDQIDTTISNTLGVASNCSSLLPTSTAIGASPTPGPSWEDVLQGTEPSATETEDDDYAYGIRMRRRGEDGELMPRQRHRLSLGDD